jgi:DnaJ domain
MLLITLLIVVLLFGLLLLTRLGGARRVELMQRWPALVCAAGALLAAARGAVWPALALAGLTVLAWFVSPTLLARAPKHVMAEDPADAAARKLLGVARGASEADIRRAYRAKMASAHPDRGGDPAKAASLTAARDRLLKLKPQSH